MPKKLTIKTGPSTVTDDIVVKKAEQLSPGATINGVLFDGTQDIFIDVEGSGGNLNLAAGEYITLDTDSETGITTISSTKSSSVTQTVTILSSEWDINTKEVTKAVNFASPDLPVWVTPDIDNFDDFYTYNIQATEVTTGFITFKADVVPNEDIDVKVVIGGIDDQLLIDNYVSLETNQIITGIKSFNSIPAFNGGEDGVSAPFTVDSNFLVTKLNADSVDGLHFRVNQSTGVLERSTDNTNWTAVSMTAEDILASLITVDGTGSLLDADLLDGLESTNFVRNDIDNEIDGVITFNDKPVFAGGSVIDSGLPSDNPDTTFDGGGPEDGAQQPLDGGVVVDEEDLLAPFKVFSNFKVKNLNADLVDGLHFRFNEQAGILEISIDNTTWIPVSMTASDILAALSTVDGTGSLLNADFLDGLNSTDFLRSNAADTVEGTLTFTSIPAFNGGDTAGELPPFSVDSTHIVTNLNADLLDNHHGSYYLDFNNFTSLPTTLSGYGITDAHTKTYIDDELDLKAPLASPTFTGTVTVPTPVNPTDATTKQYVDELSEGITKKRSVRAASTQNIGSTYYNGPNNDGEGATITADTNRVFGTVDGVTGWSVGDSVLVKNQTNKEENGVYIVSDVGANGVRPFVLQRCELCNEPSEVIGSYTFIQGGTVYGSTGWVAIVNDPSSFVVGIDEIDFIQFSGAGTYTAGTGLNLDGTQFSIDNTVVTLDGVQTLTNKTITGSFTGDLTGNADTVTDGVYLSTNQTITGTKTFSSIPAFNGGNTASTAPFTVDSAFLVTNLNADYLDNLDSSAFIRSDVADTVEGVLTFTAIPEFNGGATGTSAPFTVDSSFLVTNLNADLLDGQQGSYYLDYDNFTNTPLFEGTAVSLSTSNGQLTVTATDSNDFVSAASFNTTTGDITLTRSGSSSLTPITFNLDGRYLTSLPDHSIGSHTDVDITGAQEGETLVYDSINNIWKPGLIAGGTGDVEEAPEDGTGYYRKDGTWSQALLYNHTHDVLNKEILIIPNSGWLEDSVNNYWYRNITTTINITTDDDFSLSFIIDNEAKRQAIIAANFYPDVELINSTTIRLKAATEFTYNGLQASLVVVMDTQSTEIIEATEQEFVLFDTAVKNTSTVASLSTFLNQQDVNEYFEQTYTNLSDVDKHIIPKNSEIYDLGSLNKRWRDLYLSGSTIYLGNIQIKAESNNISFYQSDGITPAMLSNVSGYAKVVATEDDKPINALEGDIVKVTDSGITYFYDGTDWVAISAESGGISAGNYDGGQAGTIYTASTLDLFAGGAE
jgi:hypothetical protein